jgi:hypothetical protein
MRYQHVRLIAVTPWKNVLHILILAIATALTRYGHRSALNLIPPSPRPHHWHVNNLAILDA